LAADREDRIFALLDQAKSLLEAGQAGEAADVFGRILLQDPRCAEARQGLEDARAVDAELERRLEARVEDARRLAEAGEREGALRQLEDIVRAAGDQHGAVALLDRLDARSGAVRPAPAKGDAEGRSGVVAAPARRAWSRRVLVGGWSLAFAVMAAGLAFSWERLVDSLVENPSPTSFSVPSSTQIAAPSAGQEMLGRARRLLEQQDPAAAVRALDAIAPGDPAYPFARQLRVQAEEALRKAAAR
jgi:hypothetical protein